MIAPEQVSPNRRWLRTGSVAKEWGRPRRTILRWCIDGTLVEAGNAIYRDSLGYWIGIPE